MTSSTVNGCWSTVVMSSDEHAGLGGGWVQGCDLPEGHSGPHYVGDAKVADERVWLRWDDNGHHELFEMHSCRGLGNTCILFAEHDGPHVPREGAEPPQPVTHRNGGSVQTLNPVVAEPVVAAPKAPAAEADTDAFAVVKPTTNGHHRPEPDSVQSESVQFAPVQSEAVQSHGRHQPTGADTDMAAAILTLAASIDNLARSMRER